MFHFVTSHIITARSKLRKVLFWRCLWLFVCVWNISTNLWTDLRQIHREDVFSSSLGRVGMSRSNGRRPKRIWDTRFAA